MRLRSAGPLVTAAVTALLLATPWATAQAAQGQRQYREDTCFGETPTKTGLPGQTVIGTDGDDVILGGARVEAGAGDDLVCDADVVYAGPGDDRVRMLDGGTSYGGGGSDEFVSIAVSSTAAGPTLVGGRGNDIFWGGPMGETVVGGGGVDIARTGGGNDRVDLGGGNDQGYGGPGDDRFDAGAGDDMIDGGTGIDTGFGGPGIDRCLAVESRTSCPPL